MAALEDTGGYLTRGRARELFRQMDELRRDVDERLTGMEERLDDLIAFQLELERRHIAVSVELVRSFQTTRGGAAWQTSRNQQSG